LEQYIHFLDNHILVAEKPPGIPVQKDKTRDEDFSEMLKKYLKDRFNKPGNVFLGLVHRLDRPVSGLMVFARTSKALARLNEAFRMRNTVKEYLAVVTNPPPLKEQELIHYLKKNPRNNKTTVFPYPTTGAEEAKLQYIWLCSSDKYHLLKIRLYSGRHHQIRAQLAFIGCPVKGDVKYGAPRTNPGPYIHLHAWHLEFTHPVQKNVVSFYSYPNYKDPLWEFFKSHIPSESGSF